MEFKKIRIADLIPASYNPRKKLKKGDREYEKIRNSITEFGYVEPVIVNSDMGSSSGCRAGAARYSRCRNCGSSTITTGNCGSN